MSCNGPVTPGYERMEERGIFAMQTEATPEDVSKLIQIRVFSAKKRESSVKQTSILSFSERNLKLVKLLIV